MSDLKKLLPSAQSILVFDAAARTLSFKAAAAELNVTQPSVSHSIRTFENHLGVSLFIRGNRGVSLSPAGSKLQEELSPALNQIEGALKSISTDNDGIITIAVSTSVAAQWLLPCLSNFQSENPKIKIKVLTTDRNIEPGFEVDLTIRRGPKQWQRDNCWHISNEILHPVCSPAYLKSAPPIKSITDLPNHSILHNDEPFRDRMQWSQWLKELDCGHIILPQTLVFNEVEMVLQACVAGKGIGLGWSFTTHRLLKQGLLVRPLKEAVETNYAFYILGKQSATLKQECKQFVTWIRGRTEQ